MSRTDDLRLGALLFPPIQASFVEEHHGVRHRVALLGYPCDIGVERNGGVIGAKDGPASLRQIIKKVGPLINPEFSVDIRCIDFYDAGDVPISTSLEETHTNLTNSVKKLLREGYLPIIVGGGNDQSFPNALALMEATNTGQIGVVNIDAHLDARPLIEGKAHSGSPFRQLLENEKFLDDKGVFHEFAVQGNQCSFEHVEYVKSKGGDLTWLSQIRRSNLGVVGEFQKVLSSFSSMPAFVSFDIDSITSADCPGVSCPAVIGLSAQEALDICMMSGKHLNTQILDLSEFNPSVEDKRTSRLVATMIYYFLMGLASRE